MNRSGNRRWTARSLLSRALFLAVVLVLAVSLGIGQARAAATTVVTNISSDTQLYVYVPCAAGGAGEYVYLSGPLHMLFVTVVDGKGGFHSKYHYQPQGISGRGETTGATYHATGGTQGTFNGRVGFQQTYVNNFKIIGAGRGNNYLVHENLHITVKPDGTVTAYVDHYSVVCKPVVSYP
jgi:hypothetical protein